jgi:signal transduction histidine kinase/ligand-binding sensor domain-containing protein
VSTDYVIREWHMADGLPSEQIARINQDDAGFLWVATTDGVVRFDGSHFQKFPLGAEAGAKARLMAWSPRLGLLTALSTGGLEILDHGVFRPWRPAEYQNRRVVTLFVDPAGVFWLACEDGAVFRDDGKKSQMFGLDNGWPRAGVRTFATDGHGQVWISAGNFIARYAEGSWIPQSDDFSGSEVRLVSSAKNGPWVIAKDRVWRLEDTRPVEVVALPPRIGAHYVQAALEDRNGALWLGTRSEGLHVVTGEGREQVPTQNEAVYALFQDSEGNIWAGTNGSGLDRIHRKSYRLYDKSTGLLDNYSYTVCTDTRGDVWLANHDGGVVRLRNGQVERFAGTPGWPTLSAVSVFPRTEGGIGVTTGIGTFFISGGETPSIRHIDAVPNPTIRASYAAKNGDVWLAVDPDRLGRLRGEKLETFDREQGMEGHEIRTITEDNRGAIWAGGSDGNLFRLAGSRFERVPLPGIEAGAIQTIRIEADGRVWIGTRDAGVVVWSNGKIATCDTRHGMPDNDITQILPDDQGFIWFSSKHSIFRVGHQEVIDVLSGQLARVVPRLIGPDDGIKDIACSGLFQPGAWKGPDGTMWFATRRGMLALDPLRQLAAQSPPRVTIEGVSFDDRPVSFAQPLKVEAQVRKLEFRFGVLCLSYPESVRAAYRLDGFDADWVTAAPNHRASYPRLRPGTYRFHVTASLGGSGTDATLDFVVVPRWWQTTWFIAGAAVAGALGVVLVARAWGRRRLLQQLEKLERESAIRTRIAQNIHDDLGANLTHISLLTQAARQSPATGAKNFEQIHSTVGEITRSMDEIVWAVNPKFDDVESLAGYLGDFAQNFLSAAHIRCRLELPDNLPAIVLASQTRHHLFLCCKEALHNIVKHSDATEAIIAMAVAGRRFTIEISDNGRGLPAASSSAVRTDDHTTHGNGLGNMQQRMAEIGGTFTLHSGKSGGTRAIFAVECE